MIRGLTYCLLLFFYRALSIIVVMFVDYIITYKFGCGVGLVGTYTDLAKDYFSTPWTEERKKTRDLLFTLTMISFLSAFPSLSMSRNIRNSALLSASPCERRESPPSPTWRQANSSSVRSSSPSRSANIDQTFYQYCKLKEACALSNKDVWLTVKQQSS